MVSNNYTIDFTSSTGGLDSIKLGQSITYTAISLNNGVSYADTGTWLLTEDDGITPCSKASIVSFTGTTCVVKCNNVSGNVGSYIKLKYTNSQTNDTVRLLIKSVFG